MDITRRQMLQMIAATGVVVAAPPLSELALAAAEPRVVAFKGEQAATVRKIVERLGGINKFIAKGDKVVIKPNMGFSTAPLRSANTDTVVIRTLAEMALEAGAKQVQILDNPVHPAPLCKMRSGIVEALAGLDDVFVQWVKNEKFFGDVVIPNGRQLKRTQVMKAILECDALINAPMAKSHGGAIVSMGLKNWMGAVKNRQEWHSTFNMHQALADFGTYIYNDKRLKFTILAATRGLATGGPGGPGEVRHLQTIIGGFDPVAIDSFGLSLSAWNGKNYKPHQVPYMQIAEEMGLGSSDLSNLRSA